MLVWHCVGKHDVPCSRSLLALCGVVLIRIVLHAPVCLYPLVLASPVPYGCVCCSRHRYGCINAVLSSPSFCLPVLLVVVTCSLVVLLLSLLLLLLLLYCCCVSTTRSGTKEASSCSRASSVKLLWQKSCPRICCFLLTHSLTHSHSLTRSLFLSLSLLLELSSSRSFSFLLSFSLSVSFFASPSRCYLSHSLSNSLLSFSL
jgi:hypothetical protein